MKNALNYMVVGSVVLILAACPSVLAQDGPQTRSIPSDDFAKKRPSRSRPAQSLRPQRSPYKYLRTDKSFVRRATPARTEPVKAAETFAEIGVTAWRLRPPVGNEPGYRMPVQLDTKENALWLAERVSPDALFVVGDKVRFAIESSVQGYLYVFDREIYSDGTYGDPFLIFPEILGENNLVAPGMIADMPDQRDEFPYFVLNARTPSHRGELLTVIIASQPLVGLSVDAEGKLKNPRILAELELESETEIFTRDDTRDKVFSKVESDAGCGVKTRQLERVKNASKPCGKATILTADDPLPQSVYRVKTIPGKPAVIFVRLQTK